MGGAGDVSRLLPLGQLGNEHLVISPPQDEADAPAFTAIVAVRPRETEVLVRTRARTRAGFGVSALEVGEQRRLELEQFDVLLLESHCDTDDGRLCPQETDFSGTEVYSNRVVAVFAGRRGSDCPESTFCCTRDAIDAGECYDAERDRCIAR